jgi:DNA replication protein DnaC
LERAQKEKPSYADFLDTLLGAEVEAVKAKSHERRLRLAGFPSNKTLEEFDFSAQPNLDQRMVEELATLRFVEERSNVLLIGQPGVGKTMLAIALGLKAVDAGHRVYYTTGPPSWWPEAPRRPRRGAGRRRCASGRGRRF